MEQDQDTLSPPATTAADTAPALTESSVLVEPYALPEFEKKLAKLNAKAEKFGLPPIEVLGRTTERYIRVVDQMGDDHQLAYLRPMRGYDPQEHPILLERLQLRYPIIQLGNWRVVGKLETVADAGALTFTITDDEADRAAVRDYAAHPLHCEHCKAKRRRTDSFVLRDVETGERKQVGTSCLTDFTGVDPGAALFLAQMSSVIRIEFDELDASLRSGNRRALWTPAYLADVIFLTEHFGFVSAAKARDESLTATWAAASSPKMFEEFKSDVRKAYLAGSQDRYNRAEAIRQWFVQSKDPSDFHRNCALLLEQEWVRLEPRHLALAAASVATYNRHLLKAQEQKVPSEYVGQPGEKLKQKLTIERAVSLPNPYDSRTPSYLMLLRDEAGNRITWKSASVPEEMVNGSGGIVEASFKVKEHTDYKGVKQTAVTHLKVLSWVQTKDDQTLRRQQAWFDGSQVLDESGAPLELVGYGGLTFRPREAEDQSRDAVLLAIRNPWTRIHYPPGTPEEMRLPQTEEALRAKGYDGIHDAERGHWKVFDKAQVWSISQGCALAMFVESGAQQAADEDTTVAVQTQQLIESSPSPGF